MEAKSPISESNDKIPVWLDCDPGFTNFELTIQGHDDAFAIILAGHSKKLELLGISTVAGIL
jgi:inosine-uridine nucleoside N-ribohydrolase